MKRTLLIATLFAAVLPLWAAGLPPQYAATPTAKEYPSADVLVLSEKIAFTLHPDGRVEKSVSLREKMLTYQGMDDAGDPYVAFHKELQDLSVTRCRTYTPEGLTVDAKPNSFNERTPFALEKAPAYALWREMVITKVGLDVNAVVELDYTVADRKPWRRFFEGAVVLQNDRPALVREVSLTVPEGMEVHARLFGAEASPSVTRASGAETTTWTLSNVPAVPPSELHHGADGFLPTLVFSTCPDWGHQNSILSRLVAKAAAASSPALDAKVDELLRNVQGGFERALKLHAYVAESINNVSWPLAAFDHEPRAAADTFDAGYGHALDKAVLLQSMLTRAGLQAAIALGYPAVPGGLDPAPVPSLALMDRPILRVEMGQSPLWLDPTAPLSERSQRELAGLKGLPLVAGIGELHTLDYPGTDLLWANLDVKVASDLSLSGEGTVLFSGRYSPFYAVQGSAEDQKAVLSALLSSVLPGAEVAKSDVVRLEPGQVVIKTSFTAPSPSASGAKALALGVPKPSLLAAFANSHVSRRSLPTVLPHAGREHVTVTFTLPEGLRPLYVPPPTEIRNRAGSFHRAFQSSEKGLAYEWKAELSGAVVAPDAYGDLKALFAGAHNPAGRTVVWSAKP
ncbi:MAG: DUF3857 domain-containing protein [Acidobacteriota bacterium]